jgi:hypothetical protein
MQRHQEYATGTPRESQTCLDRWVTLCALESENHTQCSHSRNTFLSGPWGRSRASSRNYSWGSLTRVNSANVLDEGLRIGGRGRRMNLNVKISQMRRCFVCIENKCGTQLAQSQSAPDRPLLAPIYRWLGLEDHVGFNTNYNFCIWYHLVFWLHLYLGLSKGPQGY